MTARVAHTAITAEPLSPDTCLNAVGCAGAGGLGVFIGVVRDHDEGRQVQRLCYETHPSALDALVDVCAAVSERHDVLAIAAEHRTGELTVGEIAVVVAVAAAHRRPAIEATQDLIDTIKATVPIWKLQHFADGSSEWVGCC
ncbi:MAG: molybdenum cofactor biosynthesis protein MoaE [Actinomycetes bacterium]